MTYAWKKVHPEKSIFNCVWVIDAPWAHPLWDQYVVLLYDLTSKDTDGKVPKILLEGATHEFLIYAADPAAKIEKDSDPWELGKKGELKLLQPANYGYQFKAESNDAATARIQQIIDKIVVMELSPDTDFRSYWNSILPDMYPLVSSIFADKRTMES